MSALGRPFLLPEQNQITCNQFDTPVSSRGEMAELVEGARLEIVYTGNRIKGSNPFLSAKLDTID